MCRIKKKLKEARCCKSVFIFDLIHDNVKIRWLIPLLISFLIIRFVDSIIPASYYAKPYPANLIVVVNPPIQLDLGEISANIVVEAEDQYANQLSDVKIEIVIDGLYEYFYNQIINCDFHYQQINFWSYNFIRSLEPSSIEITGSSEITD